MCTCTFVWRKLAIFVYTVLHLRILYWTRDLEKIVGHEIHVASNLQNSKLTTTTCRASDVVWNLSKHRQPRCTVCQ